ncbi:DUF1643 domain-containing protein [bacterium]|nr:DUF1643 domain-containing protein [bacterium]
MIQCAETDHRPFGAVISKDGVYRFFLWRWLELPEQNVLFPRTPKTVTWLMLNPSTANASKDDPTIRRCLGFARQWGFGRLFVVNLFAYRSSSPRELKKHLESYDGQIEGVTTHYKNDDWVQFAARNSELLVLAWGAHLPNECEARKEEIEQIFGDLELEHAAPAVKSLSLTKCGAPRHPLYAPMNAQLLDWRW